MKHIIENLTAPYVAECKACNKGIWAFRARISLGEANSNFSHSRQILGTCMKNLGPINATFSPAASLVRDMAVM